MSFLSLGGTEVKALPSSVLTTRSRGFSGSVFISSQAYLHCRADDDNAPFLALEWAVPAKIEKIQTAGVGDRQGPLGYFWTGYSFRSEQEELCDEVSFGMASTSS